jgi:hypothetical protein
MRRTDGLEDKIPARRTEDTTSNRRHFTLGGMHGQAFPVPDTPEGTDAMNRSLSLSLTLLVGGWITSAASAQYGYPMHPAPAGYYPPMNARIIGVPPGGYPGPVMPVTAMQQQPMAMVPVMMVPVPAMRPAAPIFGPLETMPPSGPLNPHALEAVLGQPAVPSGTQPTSPPVPQTQVPVQQTGAMSASPASTGNGGDPAAAAVTVTGKPWYRKAWDRVWGK